MQPSDQNLFLMEESFRWYGPQDPVPLAYIRQTGAAAVFTSLHQIPYGDPWPRQAIRERKLLIESAGLRWTAVESVPVHEQIKTGQGDLKQLLANYTQTLRNLAAEGVHVVIYNFMPVLDWVRTDVHHVLPDGSECLLFDPAQFAAFEIHALQRRRAENDYTSEQREAARAWWNGLNVAARNSFVRGIIDSFPGCRLGLTLDDIRVMLTPYERMTDQQLTANLARFIQAVSPVAEEVGIRLAIHPDDPPFPLLGLPRIVSTSAHLTAVLAMADTPANGLCFCTGSLGARPDNDLPAMAKQFGSRINAVHLRSTRRLPDGRFYEANHLDGDVDMPAVVSEMLKQQDHRREVGRADWRLPFRPDHGHTMMNDLNSSAEITPGYSGIGRMRGLAELRGLMHGLRRGWVL